MRNCFLGDSQETATTFWMNLKILWNEENYELMFGKPPTLDYLLTLGARGYTRNGTPNSRTWHNREVWLLSNSKRLHHDGSTQQVQSYFMWLRRNCMGNSSHHYLRLQAHQNRHVIHRTLQHWLKVTCNPHHRISVPNNTNFNPQLWYPIATEKAIFFRYLVGIGFISKR